MDSKKIISGIKWTGIQFFLEFLFKFSIKLVLAKILLPNEFGLVGMCTVFIVIADGASELGMSAALIQRKEEEEVKAMYSTAFWSGLIWGILLYAITSFIIGPFAAHFYNEPILTTLFPVLSLSILIRPLSLVHVVILTRAMDFRKIAKIFNISALIAGVLALIAAYSDMGIWALVINNVLALGLTIPFLYVAIKWKPTFEWNKDYFKSIFGFGAYSTGTSIFSTLTYNIDNLIVGKILGSSLLGAYTLSFSLTEQLRQMISAILGKVMFPVYGKSQDNKEQLKDYFLKIVNFNAIIIYPIMTFLIVFSRDIIVGFFGDKWEQAVIPLKILSLAVMVHLLVNSFGTLIRGLGKPKVEMKIIIGLTILILIPSLYVGVSYFGLVGAAYAIVFNKITLVVTALIVLNKEVGLTIFDVFKAVRSAIASLLLSVCIVYILISFKIENIFILSIVYAISYLVSVYFMEKKNIENILKNVL
ncbi:MULTISPECIES: lipopolysaccharide biosynthesis protein [Algibacter]|uniref:O-antigen/teichoic acid export membrane protein n=2 Tax=Algibacter TaxID=261827 RepID=A0A4V3HGW9_9FLAO|nr:MULTISPECIES: lipopolysaccharide biosynthesis protein [Algibacter]MDN3664924.1 lipopolysaccharide biosynthesis protein [Algibacter miyuki]TDY62441.1 O-antigen/teichoic acid export membrane protein [Algibacter lectus]